MSWLLNSLSPSIAQSVIFLEYATDIWNDLRECFSQGDLLRIAELQEEIYGLSQGNRLLSDFYTALKTLWEELDNYRPFVTCSCEAKKCHQQDFVIRFLKGLDECFFVVRSQILFMDPLPTVNRVFSMVVQHECQLSVVPPSSVEPNSFVNASNGFGKGRSVSSSLSTNKNASNKKCSYCHRTGHTINVCWGKHDYPSGHPHYLGRPRFNNRDSSSSANSTASIDPVERPTASSCPITLTQAQYQSLMALIQQPNSASNATGNNLVQPNSANLIQVYTCRLCAY